MKISNDIKLSIATGVNRFTVKWKNQTLLWSELLDKLVVPTRTRETSAEFIKLPKKQQDNVKDVGGFVGGYLKNGNRSDVAYRALIALDIDFGNMELWEDWKLIYGNAAAIYSTHKHTPKSPRLRLILPLSRSVSTDEYQAVARKIADDLGIDKFDDTTYQPQRLMYWPSVSSDGEYIFEYHDGRILNPDAVLDAYTDWRDVSSWPMSSRVPGILKKSTDRQQDPTEKEGLIGAFCRTYSIRAAIEKFISDYVPCDTNDRYTYTKGSTSGGVVIYEDKWSYSHHATDPASMRLCNAWDLVRLHKFGDLDADCTEETAAMARPSYKAMVEFAMQDDAVRGAAVTERTEKNAADFSCLPEDAGKDWKKRLQITANGGIAQTIDNVVTVLQNDDKFKNVFALNEFEHAVVVLRDLPWRKIDKHDGSIWTDGDDAHLRHYLERVYGLTGKDRIFDAVNIVGSDHAFHPIREYLAKCEWDGVARVDELFIRYLGAEDTPYTRAVTRKTLVAAVARVLEPGVKFDYVLTLRGRQGLGKSTVIARLAGEWFSDTFTTVQGKEAYEQVQGVWIMEVGELAGMKKAEIETVKLFVSKQEDRFRPAYGRRIESFPRQCIFVATTNEQQFLRDTTGNRRFWVVDTPNEPTGNPWEELTPDTVKKVWAEAVKLYRAGEALYLDRELEDVAHEVQEAYREEDIRLGLVQDYLDRKLPENWDDMDTWQRRDWLASDSVGTVERKYVCHVEIWAEALGGDPNKLDRYAIKELQGLMASIPGWKAGGRSKSKKRIKPYGLQRCYFKLL